jgi:tRNA modification GTPase
MTRDDTICALSTAPGSGAIAIIRVSGNDALTITDKIFHSVRKDHKLVKQKANTLHYGRIINNDQVIDEVVVGIFKAPRSYTGEDIVEISCHGSVYIQQKILELLTGNGARLAKPGEYTMRAFLNGKFDLSQAEGVADLISSSSEAAHRIAFNQMRGGFSKDIKILRHELLNFISLIELELDFSEEDVEFADRKQLMSLVLRIDELVSTLISSFEYGNAMKNGVPVAIIGRTNAGKSTLLNLLLHEDRAIVSEIEGTTRDFIEDIIIVDGIQFRFIDTAGLRHTLDQLETEGIQRTYQKYQQADIVIVLIDLADDPKIVDQSLQFLREEKAIKKQLIFALNKTDKFSSEYINKRIDHYKENWSDLTHVIAVSAKKGTDIDRLEKLLVSLVMKRIPAEGDVVVTNIRHLEALKHTSEAVQRIKEGFRSFISVDLLAMDVREILHYLGEITGEITTDEILENIFKNFCIGK